MNGLAANVQQRSSHEQARLLDAFFQHTLTCLVILDRDFNFIRVNEAYAKACRRKVEDFPGQNHFALYPNPENEAIFRDVVRSKQRFQTAAKPFVFPDHPEQGTTYWDWTLVPILSAAGDVDFLVFSLEDVTQRKRAEQALWESEQRYRSLSEELAGHRAHLEQLVAERTAQLERVNRLLEAEIVERTRAAEELERLASFPRLNPHPITEVDEAGHVHFVNPSAERLFPDLMRSGRDHPWLADWEAATRACLDSPTRISSREVMVAGRWYEQSLHYLSEMQRFRIYGRDSTIRRKAVDEIEKTAAQLARSNEELEQFAYVASHDLQEPLRIVTGYVQLLERKFKKHLDAEADQFLHYIVDGVARMQQLISDLLNYSRVGTRGTPFRTTSMNAVIDRARANLARVIEEAGAEVTHDTLPSVQGDETQLVQLLQNLISNGIKFRSDRPAHVHISAHQKGSELVFSVRDNGIGIERQYWDQIFVIFQRLHSRQKYVGTGIGLAICKRIVERHGGRLWLESEPAVGTTFYFTLS